ncbi:MMPL family transporter [Arthrobacter sp. efr-133-TYG-118]|uniref:MMPL family transporter n=1 Tax=Arthrobacter sp. efr-133-TYG-118 TaxID=3040279 RepID=UPI00254F3A94|nr:MMPL family transporter [Arthrobacter sp. efr-133-TYG-118]
MARLLYQLGILGSRHRVWFFAAWAVIFVALGVVVFGGVKFSTDAFKIPGSESMQALKVVDEKFPASKDAPKSLTLVFKARDGAVTSPATVHAIGGALTEIAKLDHVAAVSDPLSQTRPTLSPDLSVAVATVTLDGVTDGNAPEIASNLKRVADSASSSELTIAVGGSIAGRPAPSQAGPSEMVGIVIAFAVLLITFGSLLAAGANMLSAVASVGVSMLAVLGFSTISPIQNTTPTLAIMLGLAVAIDYGLFVLARFRAELKDGNTVEEAVGRATGTAGTAVVFAGSTVMIALLGLAVVDIPFITEMGVAGAIAVLIAVLMTLTFMPAVMRSLGRRALSRRDRKSSTSSRDNRQLKAKIIERWGRSVIKRPLISVVTAVTGLLIVAIPVLSMQTSLSTPGGEDPKSTQRIAYDIMTHAFGAGSQDPLIVLVEGDHASSRTNAVNSMIRSTKGVKYSVAGAVTGDGNAAIIQVIPATGPLDPATTELVHAIRAQANDIQGLHLSVTGSTAVALDTNEKLQSALIAYLCVVVGLSLLLLILMFRSILVPLIATLGFLLTLGAALGIVVAIFQWSWFDDIIPASQGNPILALLPLMVTGILFGLAMDYQVFLVSRIREAYVHGHDPKEAIREGFRLSGPVVVAAASIMAAVFGGFAFSDSSFVAPIGFALAGGVIVDAFIVRMIIVPALLSLLGRSAWWIPRWLDRALPDLDTEGHSLERDIPQRAEEEKQLV